MDVTNTQHRDKSIHWKSDDSRVAFVFLLPAILFFSLYILYPIVSTIRYSFYEWSGISDKKVFIGLENYVSAFQNNVVIQAILHNFIFLIVGIFIILPFSFLVALTLAKAKIKLKNF